MPVLSCFSPRPRDLLRLHEDLLLRYYLSTKFQKTMFRNNEDYDHQSVIIF